MDCVKSYYKNRVASVSFGLWLAAGLLLTLAGCNAPKEHLEQFNAMYMQGNLAGAKVFSEQRIKDPNKPSGEDLLWALQLGAVERAGKSYSDSIQWFDRCEDMMKVFDPQSRETDVIGTTLVNDNIIPYRGWTYDGIMVNTYKALNFMALGKNDDARVEFNRAMERQTRAKEKFSAEIQKEKDKKDKANAEKQVDYNKTTENPDVQKQIKEAYPGLYEFEAYPDYVNPFSTYLAGVFFAVIGDSAKARDLLKESAGMLPGNQYVKSDFESAERWLGGNKAPEPAVWVFFENGVGPTKEEFRVDLPLFLFTGKVYYAGIALPKLVQRWPACERLTIQSGGQYYPTEVVGDMDRVVQTEFSKEYRWILTRAIIAAGAKAAAQYALTEQNSNSSQLAAAMVALYSFATTAADVRIWSALPKDFQAAKFPMPGDGKLTIQTPQGNLYPLTIPSCRYAIVYIKMVSASNEPTIEVMTY
jgi:hypothetical protein